MSKKQDKQSLAASQLAALLAAQGQQFSQYNPGQAQYGAYLLDSAQGQIAAQNAYIAEKKRKKEEKKKGLGGLLGTGAAVAAAPFTGGASLALAPGLSQAGSGIASGDMGQAASGLAGAAAGGYKAWGTPAAAAPTELSDTAQQSFGVLAPQYQQQADVASGYAPYNASQSAFRGGAAAIPPDMMIDPVTGKLVPKKSYTEGIFS